MKMKWLLVAVTVLALSAPAAGPALAETMTMCDTPTIPALIDCVNHAATMGAIDNAGVTQALLATLNAAQAALLQGNTGTAINLLNAFINQVQAQSGVHITADHAAHMIMHAQNVIATLGG